MLWSCVCPSVCLFVCLSYADIVLKWLNVGSCKQAAQQPRDFGFLTPKIFMKFENGRSPSTGAPNTGEVGKNHILDMLKRLGLICLTRPPKFVSFCHSGSRLQRSGGVVICCVINNDGWWKFCLQHLSADL